MRKNKQLKELFIEDLGKVTGGGGGDPTTQAIGEEDPMTTEAIGEEDPVTSQAIGEEDPFTTLSLGEE
jgi:hypothetical protein